MLDQLPNDTIKIRGFFRIAIRNPDGKIAADSGEIENQITNDGKRYFLSYLLGNIAGSVQVSHVAVGSGTAPASNATTLDGEVVKRAAVSAASSGSSSVQFTATFDSSASFVTNTQNLSNIGLFNSSSGGYLFGGNTYTSSSCATNQSVNVTYRITFS